MTDPSESNDSNENSRANSSFSVDMRNWALNSIRSPTEVVDIIPDMTLLPESFFSYSSFFETDASALERLGDDADTLQGLADWLSGTDMNYLQLKEPERVYVPELSVPHIPDKLPTIAQKVTNSCFQRFPSLKLQGVIKPPLKTRDAQEIFDEVSKPDPDYDLSAGFEDAVVKLLQQEFLPEPSASNMADFEIRRPAEDISKPTKEPVRPKPNKAPQAAKEMRNIQLNRFLGTVIDFADEMVPDRDNNPELDLVFFDGESKILSLITVSKIEKLVVKAIAENALELLSNDVTVDLFRLLQNTVLYAGTKSVFPSTPNDSRTPEEMESECLAVEAAVAAARLALQMANNLDKGFSKAIYNEALVTSSLSLVRHQLDHTILPALDVLTEASQKPEETTCDMFVRKDPARVSKLALGISGFAQEFGRFLKTNELAFNIAISLVFTCLAALFSELVRGAKIAIFSPGASVNFKKQFQSVLQTIFVLYPEQRSLIVEEVINSLINLPADKRSHKSFRLLDGKSIHIATAIVLQLSQSCAELAICKPLIASPDFSRLQAETFSTSSSSFVPVVEMFVSSCRAGLEDSIKVVGPVLQFLLTRVSKGNGPNEAEYKHILDTMVEDSLDVLNMPEWPAAEIFLRSLCLRLFKVVDESTDPALKSLAIDYFGAIASRIKKHTPESLAAAYEEHSSEMESLDLISSIQHMPDELGLDTSGLVLKSLWACFERLACYLKAVSSEESTYECSRQFLFCEWGQYLGQPWASVDSADSPVDKDTRDFIKSCLSKIIKQSCSKVVSDSLFVTEQVKVSNRAMTCALSEALACKSKLFRNFEPILATILRFTESPSLMHRTRAVRALVAILKECPDIVSMERVQKCMRLRLQDTSIAVRSAAVDFIGRCMITQPAKSQEYYPDIGERILDTGVSIRQRVIKILRVVSKTADAATLADISSKLLMRTQDGEAKVRALARASLQDIWFSPIEGHDLPNDCEALLNDSQQLRLDSLPPLCRNQLTTRATMITSMVTNLATSPNSDQLISDFLSKSLEKPPEPRSEAAVRHWSTCSVIGRLLIDGFFHNLVLLKRDSNKEAVCHTLKALVAFGTTGGLLVPAMHLNTLLPYIHWGQERIMYYALKIYNFILPRLENPNLSFLKKVELQIINNIPRVAMSVLNESIPCLCHIAYILNPGREGVLKVYRLHSAREASKNGELILPEPSTVRLLVLLGLFGQHMDLGCIKSGSTQVLITDDLLDDMFENMFYFMSSKASVIRAAAVQGLGNLAIAYPKLLLREELRAALLDALESNDMLVKSKLLTFLTNYLNHDSTKLSAEPKPDGNLLNNLNDAGICNSIVQTLLPTTVECILADEFEIQLLGLQFIARVLEQGHINPMMCLPALVALQTETSRHLVKLAGDIYSKLEAKFPKLIHTRHAEVFECVFNYHRRRGSKTPPKGYHPLSGNELPRALLHFIYKSVRSTTSRRADFFNPIFNLFDLSTKKRNFELGFLKFLAENLAALDYQTPEEIHELLILAARAIVPGEAALQYLEGNVTSLQAMTEAKAVQVADATSLLLILKHSLQVRFGLRNIKAYREKTLTSQPFNAIPWETFEFGQQSAHRLKVLFDRDLTFFQPDENLFKDSLPKPRGASSSKKRKGPAKPSAKPALSSEDDLMSNMEDLSGQESEESLEDMEP